MRTETIHPTRTDPSAEESEPTHDDALLGSAWDREIESEWVCWESSTGMRLD